MWVRTNWDRFMFLELGKSRGAAFPARAGSGSGQFWCAPHSFQNRY